MFYIVNDMDRPSQRYVAEDVDGKLNYLARDLKEHDGMSLEYAVPLHLFGFIWHDLGDKVEFTKVAPSYAQYKDGKAREWQGSDSFSILRGSKK